MSGFLKFGPKEPRRYVCKKQKFAIISPSFSKKMMTRVPQGTGGYAKRSRLLRARRGAH